MVASKLLANDDRWADRGLFSRDILDLALLPWSTGDWNRGHHKAIRAYGSSIDTSLHRARAQLLDHHRRLPDCMNALHITTVTEQQMRQRLLALPV